jgi:hypothetical protein
MTVDIVNYNNLTNNGLLNINISDNNYSFNNVFVNDNGKLISIYDFLNIEQINVITDTKISYNICNDNGLYLITYEIYENHGKHLTLRKINEDESELISNIDCNSNYIIRDTCKLYKAGSCITSSGERNLYYCYGCGRYIFE